MRITLIRENVAVDMHWTGKERQTGVTMSQRMWQVHSCDHLPNIPMIHYKEMQTFDGGLGYILNGLRIVSQCSCEWNFVHGDRHT